MRTALLMVSCCLGLAASQDGPRGTGTAFKNCGGTFFGGSDRCFEVTLKKFQVQIGSEGTNEDVKVKVCSDDQKTCCTTPALKKTFSDDWSPNDLEQWSEDRFGDCRGKKFRIKRGLDVTILKEGSDLLTVTSLFIDAEGVTDGAGAEKSPERFECGRFRVQGANSRNSSTNFCGTSPYSYERIKEIKVKMGPDGTNDDVSAEFCSDVNAVCCRTKLSSLLGDDWSKNDDEEWEESDLGKCKTMQYKVRSGIRFTLLKNGKDDLLVNKLTVSTTNLRGAAFNYDCKDFQLKSQGQTCVEGVTCKQEKLCQKAPSLARTTTKKPKSTRRTTTKRTNTTKKPGLVDRIKSGLGFGSKNTTTTTTTRRPTTTTTKATTTTKKPGVLDRIKDTLGLGGKKTTTTTTTRRGLLSQGEDVVNRRTTPSTRRTTRRTTTRTTRRPFRG